MDSVLKDLRIQCLKLAHQCQDGNLQSAFSCMEILWTLYDKRMCWSPSTATGIGRDILVISKGQATLALFSVLIKKGLFKEEELKDIGSFNSIFSIQTDITKFKKIGGVENSAGSLGHGLPIAVGMAMANKIQKNPGRVYVLVGDGEMMEGTMWESFLLIKEKKLDNITVIIDSNASASAMIKFIPLEFGFSVVHANGHNQEDLLISLQKSPTILVAYTNRGHGSRTLQSDPVWFHKSPNAEELKEIIKEIGSL